LAYQAFLGNQYGDDGVQVRWVAPTDLFFEVGGEAMRGERFPSGGAGHAGYGRQDPLFAHSGGDVGTNNEWLAGVSMLAFANRWRRRRFPGRREPVHRRLHLEVGAGGNTKDGGVTVRSEYLHEDRDGLYIDPAMPRSTTVVGQRDGRLRRRHLAHQSHVGSGYRYDHCGPTTAARMRVRSIPSQQRDADLAQQRIQPRSPAARPGPPNAAGHRQHHQPAIPGAFGAHGAHKF
jgi:hypothetical protein